MRFFENDEIFENLDFNRIPYSKKSTDFQEISRNFEIV